MNMRDAAALDTLIRDTRTHQAWLDKPVSDQQPCEIGAWMTCGPTSANCSPARANFACSLGYGDAAKRHPRLPRLQREEACGFSDRVRSS